MVALGQKIMLHFFLDDIETGAQCSCFDLDYNFGLNLLGFGEFY